MKGFLLKRELPDEEKEKFSRLEGGEELYGRLQQGIPAISLNSYTSLIDSGGNDTSFVHDICPAGICIRAARRCPDSDHYLREFSKYCGRR